VKIENYVDDTSNAADADSDAGNAAVSLKPSAGSNLSWPLLAYLGTMTILLVIVAVWDVMA
jgi:hypothetical protein